MNSLSTSALPVAIVGAGRIGAVHAEGIASSDNIALAAIADPVEPTAPVFEGVPRLPDVSALLEHGGFAAAIVASPTGTHREIVLELIAAGVPVLCEKPCGLTAADTEVIANAARLQGVPVAAGYWRRHLPALAELAAQIRAGQFGEVFMVNCAQYDQAPPPPAFRDPASSGGIVVDMGVHELDMLRWLTGAEITSLVGTTSVRGDAEPVEGDPFSATLAAGLADGTGSLISLARRYPPGDLCRIEVLGTKRALALDYLAPGNADARLREALCLQAESLLGMVESGEVEGADLDDAVAAHVAAASLAAPESPAPAVEPA